MQKKLLTAAVSLALAAPAVALAQATLYGVVDVNYQNVSNYATTVANKSALGNSGAKSSRLGARVSEDLGGGLSARAVIEFDISADTGGEGSNHMTGRQTLISLDSKSWGELALGRQLTHNFNSTAMAEGVAGANSFQSMYNMTDTQTRSSNYVKYASPNFQGFTFGAGWAPGEDTGNNDGNNDYMDFALRYEAGNFGATYSYAQIETVQTALGQDFKEKDNVLAGYFNFNPFKVLGLYKTSKRSGTLGAATGEDLKIWTLRGEFSTGPGIVAVSFGKVKDDLTANANSSFFGLGYYHNLSKRTTAYATYGRTKNDPLASRTINGNFVGNATLNAGVDPRGFQVGMHHTF